MAPAPLTLDPHAGSTPLANQVAGHQNVLSDASGSLVIKPALPREIAFYHLLNSASRSAPVYKLKTLVPQFFGTLRLEGRMDGEGGITAEGLKPDEVPESVVLENLSHLYTHPSIMDVKLGTVLAGPDAPPEKQARMEAQAKGSTSWETGVRLTGCQTWHAPTQSYILTPKSYGKGITAAQLPEGITRFFPLPNDVVPSIVVPPTPPASSSTSTPLTSDPISHLPLPSENVATSLAPPTPVTGSSNSTSSNTESSISKSPTAPSGYTSHAIPPRTLLRVLALVDHSLSELEGVISQLEARFIGASILIVYEGEPARLESALDRWEAKRAREALIAAAAPPPTESEDVYDSDEDDYDGIDDEEDSSTSSDDDEDDGAAADARRARRCPPVTLKMIDFAHTRLVEGDGPDEGVLKGVRTLRGLVQGRAEAVRREVYKQGQDGSAATQQGPE